MKLCGILETALYVADLERSERFYRRLFALEPLFSDDRLRALAIDDNHVLLLFLRGASVTGADSPVGHIPGHDGQGQLHLAFHVSEAEFPAWKAHLATHDITLIAELPLGKGHSLYFHDPDGHVVELATPGIWR